MHTSLFMICWFRLNPNFLHIQSAWTLNASRPLTALVPGRTAPSLGFLLPAAHCVSEGYSDPPAALNHSQVVSEPLPEKYISHR